MTADNGSNRSASSTSGSKDGRKSSRATDAPAKVTVMKLGSPDALEAQIQARRERLAATIDELTARATPKAIARKSLAGVQAKIRNATHTPDGQLRTERLVAIGAAAVALSGALIWIRRRR
jgi:hypothetical protein